MVAGVNVRNVGMNGAGEGVGFECPATHKKYGAISEHDACLPVEETEHGTTRIPAEPTDW